MYSCVQDELSDLFDYFFRGNDTSNVHFVTCSCIPVSSECRHHSKYKDIIIRVFRLQRKTPNILFYCFFFRFFMALPYPEHCIVVVRFSLYFSLNFFSYPLSLSELKAEVSYSDHF